MIHQKSSIAPVVIKMHNNSHFDVLSRVVLHWGSLPKGASIHIALETTDTKQPRANVAAFSKQGIKIVENAASIFPKTIDAGCARQVSIKDFRIYSLSPDEKRKTELPEILIRKNAHALAAIRVSVPQSKAKGKPSQFDLVQMAGTRVLGGFTFVI